MGSTWSGHLDGWGGGGFGEPLLLEPVAVTADVDDGGACRSRAAEAMMASPAKTRPQSAKAVLPVSARSLLL